jgi:hypothetical protein
MLAHTPELHDALYQHLTGKGYSVERFCAKDYPTLFERCSEVADNRDHPVLITDEVCRTQGHGIAIPFCTIVNFMRSMSPQSPIFILSAKSKEEFKLKNPDDPLVHCVNDGHHPERISDTVEMVNSHFRGAQPGEREALGLVGVEINPEFTPERDMNNSLRLGSLHE